MQDVDLEQGLIPESSERFSDDQKKDLRWLFGLLYLICIFGVIGLIIYLIVTYARVD